MPVVSTLVFQVLADTSKFSDGMAVTRKELSAAKRVVEETRTPIELYEVQIANLNSLMRKGAIDQETFTRATAKLKSSLAAAAASGSKAESVFQAIAKSALPGAAAVGSVAAAAALATVAIKDVIVSAKNMAAGQFREIDATGDLVAALGVTAEGYSVLRYAASQTGAESDILDAALKRLAIGLGNAENGSGKITDVLRQLQLTLRDVSSIPADQAIRLIGERMLEIESPTQRAAIAAELFTKQGVGLLNLLDAIGGGYDDLAAAARAAGVVLDESGIAKVQAADDAMQRMGQSIKGVGNLLAVEFAPAIESISGHLTTVVQLFDDVQAALASTAGKITEWLYRNSGGLFSGAVDALAGSAINTAARGDNARRNENARARAIVEAATEADSAHGGADAAVRASIPHDGALAWKVGPEILGELRRGNAMAAEANRHNRDAAAALQQVKSGIDKLNSDVNALK